MSADESNAHEIQPNAEDWESPPPSIHPSSAAPLASSPSEALPVGTIVGQRYEVVGVLGKGGFGVVYDARHVELETKVALKVLHPRLTAEPRLFGRFQQEARSSAAIGHPNIVQVFDLGMDEHGAYIAMEKLEGEELADRIERAHPLPEALVARIGAEVADAMAAAHERGVIHRDLKPQNVFLARSGRREVAKVIDFGIAKLLHRVEGDLTATGQLFGTPRFMAPEQFRGAKNVDGRVDVYAIGALLYRALTAAYPYDGETYPELMLQIMADSPPPVSGYRPDVTEPMVRIVERAMAKRPEDRFQTAAELAEVLHEHAQTAPARAPIDAPRPPVRLGPLEERTKAVGEGLAPAPTARRRPAPRAPVAIVAGVGVALLAALGGLAAWAGGSGAGGSGAEVPSVESDRAARDAIDATEPSVEPAPSGDAVAAPAAPVIVHVETDPEGAQLRVAGALACRTPCDARLVEVPVLLTAELEGYTTTERYVPAPAPRSVWIVLPRRPVQARESGRARRAGDRGASAPAAEAPPPLLDR